MIRGGLSLLIEEVPLVFKPLVHIFEVIAEVEVMDSVRLDAMDEREVLLNVGIALYFDDSKLVELLLDAMVVRDLFCEDLLNARMAVKLRLIEILERGLLLDKDLGVPFL